MTPVGGGQKINKKCPEKHLLIHRIKNLNKTFRKNGREAAT
jgi:hypothetical protein